MNGAGRRAPEAAGLAAAFSLLRGGLRRFAALAEGRVAFALAAAIAGTLHYALAAFLQRALSLGAPSLVVSGPALSATLSRVAFAILTEELPRLAACLAFALAARKARYGALALFGPVASTAFALLENLAFLSAFPDASTLWRLSWSTPIHVGAALAFALAFAPLARGEARETANPLARGSLALAAAFLWHLALNLGALAWPGPALRLAAGAANLAALAALAARATAALDRPSLIDLDIPRPARTKRRGRGRDATRGVHDGFERA